MPQISNNNARVRQLLDSVLVNFSGVYTQYILSQTRVMQRTRMITLKLKKPQTREDQPWQSIDHRDSVKTLKRLTIRQETELVPDWSTNLNSSQTEQMYKLNKCRKRKKNRAETNKKTKKKKKMKISDQVKSNEVY